MQILIDIDEETYKDIKKGKMYTSIRDVPQESITAIKNGIPFSEKLEKIKAEIQGLIDFEESCCGDITLGYQCLGVIEDIISELKGENK